MYTAVTTDNTPYRRGFCQSQFQGHDEGHACALTGINLETNETAIQAYDCIHRNSLEMYSKVLTVFGKCM